MKLKVIYSGVVNGSLFPSELTSKNVDLASIHVVNSWKQGGGKTQPLIMEANENATPGLKFFKIIILVNLLITIFEDGVGAGN